MSAAEQLDALDRGVVEAGVTAAEAVARVEALEAEVAELRVWVRRTWECMREATGAAGLPVPEEYSEGNRPHLTVVLQ